MNKRLLETTDKIEEVQVQKRKILIAAYACNPYSGSEQGVGWGWVSAIAEKHDVWVIAGALYRNDIEKEISKNADCCKNIRFYYVPRIRWLWLEKVWPPAYLWTYRIWQKEAYKLSVKLNEEIDFDIAHQLTYVGFRVPGYLWKLDIPFVWGPIGGLENTPWKFLTVMGLRGFIYYAGRNIINSLHKRYLSGPKMAFKKAHGGIIAATQGIRREILRWYGEESDVICEIGPPPEVADSYSLREPGESLKLSWSGLHLPGKALPLLLRAVAALPDNFDWQSDILGRGPLTKKWQKLAIKLGIDNRCNWAGWLSRDRAISIVHNSHIFVITSLKDLTSTVLLEALSQGVPVICPDHCGFSNVVTGDCGVKIPIESPNQFVSDLSAAIRSLAENEEERRRLAKGALQRIKDFSWEKKAELVDSIYRRITASHRVN